MRKLIASFRFVFAGLAYLLRSQRNVRFHLIAAILAVVAGFVLKIGRLDWTLIIMAITLVFAAESFNTALELLADRISSEHDPLIGRAKDVAAAAVLITTIGAVGTAIVVFGPALHTAFQRGSEVFPTSLLRHGPKP
jgi:diacylglycerol kinase